MVPGSGRSAERRRRRIETNVVDQRGRHTFPILVVLAIDHARSICSAPRFKYTEEHFAGYGAKRGNHPDFASLLRQFLRADELWATTRSVFLAFIGNGHTTRVFPDRSSACCRRSSIRSQCTASKSASASRAASAGAPASALPFASRANRLSFCGPCFAYGWMCEGVKCCTQIAQTAEVLNPDVT